MAHLNWRANSPNPAIPKSIPNSSLIPSSPHPPSPPPPCRPAPRERNRRGPRAALRGRARVGGDRASPAPSCTAPWVLRGWGGLGKSFSRPVARPGDAEGVDERLEAAVVVEGQGGAQGRLRLSRAAGPSRRAWRRCGCWSQSTRASRRLRGSSARTARGSAGSRTKGRGSCPSGWYTSTTAKTR